MESQPRERVFRIIATAVCCRCGGWNGYDTRHLQVVPGEAVSKYSSMVCF
jgi:hypothetical protein